MDAEEFRHEKGLGGKFRDSDESLNFFRDPPVLLNNDSKLTVLELKQGSVLQPWCLWFDTLGREIDCSTLPTNGFSFSDIPFAEVTLADEAKVTDGCRTSLHLSDCVEDF